MEFLSLCKILELEAREEEEDVILCERGACRRERRERLRSPTRSGGEQMMTYGLLTMDWRRNHD